jgi:hypothetical protein
MEHLVYWIYGENCFCPWRHGYIGRTGTKMSRIKGSKKRLKAKGYLIIGHSILFRGARQECCEREHALRPTANIGWNRAPGGGGGHDWASATRAKVSATLTGKKKSNEHIENVRIALVGRPQSLESIEKNRLGHIGIRDSIETKEKKRISAFQGWEKRRQKGWQLSPEQKMNVKTAAMNRDSRASALLGWQRRRTKQTQTLT